MGIGADGQAAQCEAAATSQDAPATAESGADANGAAKHGRFWPLLIGCVGVVYGDIGTSPLYALREAVTAAGGA